MILQIIINQKILGNINSLIYKKHMRATIYPLSHHTDQRLNGPSQYDGQEKYWDLSSASEVILSFTIHQYPLLNKKGMLLEQYQSHLSPLVGSKGSMTLTDYDIYPLYPGGEEQCYSQEDNGRSYRGSVNYTEHYEPCTPWEQVQHCPVDLFTDR